MDRYCTAQDYRYDNGSPVAKYCHNKATMRIRGGDGIYWNACDKHGKIAIEAGAQKV